MSIPILDRIEVQDALDSHLYREIICQCDNLYYPQAVKVLAQDFMGYTERSDFHNNNRFYDDYRELIVFIREHLINVIYVTVYNTGKLFTSHYQPFLARSEPTFFDELLNNYNRILSNHNSSSISFLRSCGACYNSFIRINEHHKSKFPNYTPNKISFGEW